MWSLLQIYIAVGLRTNMFKVLMVFALLMVFAAWLSSGFSARQPSSMMLDFGFSVLRLVLCLMSLMWLQELLGKAIDKRYIAQILAYPLSKPKILLANYGAVAALLWLALVSLALLLVVAAQVGSFYEQTTPANLGWAYAVTWVYIYIDLLAVLAFALVITSISTTPQLPLMFGLAFYIIGHGLGPILDYLVAADTVANAVQRETFSPVLSSIRYIVPELSRLDMRELSLYSETVNAGYLLRQAVFGLSYIVAMLAIAVLLFKRREFE